MSCRTWWSFPTCHFLVFTECRAKRVYNNDACLQLVYNFWQSFIREMFNLVIMCNQCLRHDVTREMYFAYECITHNILMNKKIYNNIPITVWHMGWPKKDTPFQSLNNRSKKNLIITLHSNIKRFKQEICNLQCLIDMFN